MKTSTLSRALVLGAASVPALTAVSCDKMPERKPNVIFILMDDAGYGDFGCYGQTRIETPNIDSLAARGIRFTDMYSAAPLSSPARCGLLTGMHTGHAQIRANDDKLYASRRTAKAAAPAAEASGEKAPAKEPVVKAPTRSSESELDIMVEE